MTQTRACASGSSRASKETKGANVLAFISAMTDSTFSASGGATPTRTEEGAPKALAKRKPSVNRQSGNAGRYNSATESAMDAETNAPRTTGKSYKDDDPEPSQKLPCHSLKIAHSPMLMAMPRVSGTDGRTRTTLRSGR